MGRETTIVNSGFEVLLSKYSHHKVSDGVAREIKVLGYWLFYILLSNVNYFVAIVPLP